MITDSAEAAPGVETLASRICATLQRWGGLSVPTLAVKLGVAPLHIRDAIDIDDRLTIEGDLVQLVASSTQALCEAHLAVHGTAALDALAMALGRRLADVRTACHRSRKITLVGQMAMVRR